MSTVDDVEAFELLERASSEVRALADRMETIGGQFEARLSNPWRREIPSLVSRHRLAAEERSSIFGADGGEPLGRSQTIASIWASRDHLYAISNCLVDRTVFSLMSLSRIVMEAACTAAWLNAEGEYSNEILWRSIVLAHGNLLEQVGLSKIALESTAPLSDAECRAIIAEQEHCDVSKACLEISAYALGLPPIQRANKPQIVQDIMEHLVEYLDVDVSPAIFYKMYSGAMHGDPNTMVAMLDRGAPASEHGLRAISVHARLVPVTWAAAAATMMLTAVDHWWDTPININGIDLHVNALSRIARQAQQ